ncbi:MAG: flavin-containing monooxygenase [Thermoleophilaceae bacterium]
MAEHATPDHVDVLIVGAGISGIGAACHLQAKCPGKSYAILEAREAIGGTWDLFRYPGIRSDSDMFTLGFSFRPWTEAKAIADGPSILEYVRDTAREGGVERNIRFGHKAVAAQWSSPDARWTVQARREDTAQTVTMTCDFLYMCSGYYHYDAGYTPEFEGSERFGGQVVHPQHWPEDLDYEGKRVVVIGSGATAVTLVPAMAGHAAHVTMLQRSPSYVTALPGEDPIANFLRRALPAKLAYFLIRWKNVLLMVLGFQLSRRRPEVVKRFIRMAAARRLPPGYDLDTHFKPAYDPWDQRLCVVPDGDLFKAIADGDASVVTDHIERFTETGLQLTSGAELQADVIVTATGLRVLGLAGMQLTVDGRDVDVSQTMAYKSLMLDGVPNMAFVVGYSNASWTLKADLTSEYLCRLLNHMDAHGYDRAMPCNSDCSIEPEPFMDLTAGYVLRGLDQFPKQGSKAPWKLHMSYPRDIVTLRHRPIEDGTMQLSRC